MFHSYQGTGNVSEFFYYEQMLSSWLLRKSQHTCQKEVTAHQVRILNINKMQKMSRQEDSHIIICGLKAKPKNYHALSTAYPQNSSWFDRWVKYELVYLKYCTDEQSDLKNTPSSPTHTTQTTNRSHRQWGRKQLTSEFMLSPAASNELMIANKQR